MRSDDPCVTAILCADIHLCLKAPIARSGEKDWFKAMTRPLNELRGLQKTHDCPIICAGDVFDRWNSSPELVNFAIKHLPKMYAVPGQHDLPLHNYEDIRKSAYWTLVEAGVIVNLLPGKEITLGSYSDSMVRVVGFPWGYPITKPEEGSPIILAVSHQYVWIDNHGYPGAPGDNKMTKARKDLRGYDAAVFGDNHKGFLTKRGTTSILNCGGFMRRKADEVAYQPCVGLLRNDGTIVRHQLDIAEDKIESIGSTIDVGEDMELQKFLKELASLEESTLDFSDAMKRALLKIKPNKAVKELLLEAME